MLDVLFWELKASSAGGLGISLPQFFSQKKKKKFSCFFFLQLLVIKTVDPDSLEMLDPDPYPDPDPQHCFKVNQLNELIAVFRIRISRIHTFLGSRIRIHLSNVWIRIRIRIRICIQILLSSSKKVRKPLFLLFSEFFWTFYLWKMM